MVSEAVSREKVNERFTKRGFATFIFAGSALSQSAYPFTLRSVS